MSDDERACRGHEDAVAFALHALGPDEEETVREHLAVCPSCRATVAEAERTAAALAAAVEQVDPPVGLREDLITRAEQTPQIASGPAAAPGPGPSATAPAAAARIGAGRFGVRRGRSGGARPPAVGNRPHPGHASRGPRRRGVVAALALVAVIGVGAAGGLGAYAVQLQQQRAAQIEQSRALADVLTRLDRPGTSHATLSTGEGEPVGAVVADGSARLVVTSGLPANDFATSTYVLWGLGPDAAPVPIGTFDVGRGAPGPGVHQLGPGGNGQAFDAYAVSLEPGRVPPTAPSAVVASGQAQA